MEQTIFLIKLHCQICFIHTWHIIFHAGGMECLKCRSEGRDRIPVTHYPPSS